MFYKVSMRILKPPERRGEKLITGYLVTTELVRGYRVNWDVVICPEDSKRVPEVYKNNLLGKKLDVNDQRFPGCDARMIQYLVL
jgi:hypothetical protein